MSESGLYPLRPVQEKALAMMRASVRSGRKRPQLQLSTGVGKTIIACHMIASALEKKKRVTFTVPLLNLVDQTVDKFEANGVDPDLIGVIQSDHERRRPHAPVQVASIQTLARREVPKTDLVIVDESHLIFQAMCKWQTEAPDKIFVGLSATPWALGMSRYYDDLLIPATMKELIAAGDLCRYRAYAPNKPDLSEVEIARGDYVQGQLAETMGRPKIVGDVVATWLERAQDRPTMLFAVNRAHAALLHDQFCRYGVRSAYVDAFTDREERLAVRDLFERGELKVICSVGTMNAGVDLPSVSCVSFCRPTKSSILLIQSLGRGMRLDPKNPDKELLILDHSGSILDLGLPDEIGFSALRDGDPKNKAGPRPEKKLASPRECPDCGVIVPALERACRCGHRFKYWANVDMLEGELYEIGGDSPEEQRARRSEMGIDDKAIFYGMLKHYGMSHGYKSGWAFFKYQARMGCQPTAEIKRAVPIPASNEVKAWIVRVTRQWSRAQR